MLYQLSYSGRSNESKRGPVWAGMWAGTGDHECLSVPIRTHLKRRLTTPDHALPVITSEVLYQLSYVGSPLL